jgi:transketolase
MEQEVYTVQQLEEIANRLRIKIVQMIAYSGLGHAGGSMSITEIVTTLYFREMRLDKNDPDFPDRDRLILSKGHAVPALYAAFTELGYLSEDLLYTMHKIDSPLQMHPEYGECPGVEMSTGALGQGLSASVGMAIGAKIKKKSFRVYAILGDGELAEGQIWEAAMAASKYNLDNLVALIDYNKLALTDKTDIIMPLEPILDKWQSFGWQVFEINGHSIEALIDVFDKARAVKGKPVAVICHTEKGHKIPHYAGQPSCHSVSFTQDQLVETLKSLRCDQDKIEKTLNYIREKN